MAINKAAEKWLNKPGSFDTCHITEIYGKTMCKYGIPNLMVQDFKLPGDFRLQPYKSKVIHRHGICHFYLDDYRFEHVWSRPLASLKHVKRYWAVLTPDFSLMVGWPPVVQMWNTYRSRWMGRWWAEQGINVIPTINWSDEASFEYCFVGIPENQIVSISTPDMRNKTIRRRFEAGAFEMCARLNPSLVICYGNMRDIELPCEVIEVAPDWNRRFSGKQKPSQKHR